MSSTRSDVLILGGGVIGLSCALALLRTGASVRVLERLAAAVRRRRAVAKDELAA